MNKLLATLILGALALPGLADIPDDYWSPENMAKRQCASVHLGYLPTLPSHTAAYTAMMVEKSAPGTYFCANNFGCGYIGFQEVPREDGSTYRVAIFSIWDAKSSGDDPHAAPESERAKLVQRGKGVRTTRFGGEGTGGKSMRLFPWKEGDVLKTLVIEKPDGENFRQIAGYVLDPATGQWELMSCWRIQALKRGLGGGCGFVEDFIRNVESKGHERRATFGPAFRWTGDSWSQAYEFSFTKDKNPNREINCRRNMQRGYYSLATGGSIAHDADFPPFVTRRLEPLPQASEPGADVMELIRAPKLEMVEYADDGAME